MATNDTDQELESASGPSQDTGIEAWFAEAATSYVVSAFASHSQAGSFVKSDGALILAFFVASCPIDEALSGDSPPFTGESFVQFYTDHWAETPARELAPGLDAEAVVKAFIDYLAALTKDTTGAGRVVIPALFDFLTSEIQPATPPSPEDEPPPQASNHQQPETEDEAPVPAESPGAPEVDGEPEAVPGRTVPSAAPAVEPQAEDMEASPIDATVSGHGFSGAVRDADQPAAVTNDRMSEAGILAGSGLGGRVGGGGGGHRRLWSFSPGWRFRLRRGLGPGPPSPRSRKRSARWVRRPPPLTRWSGPRWTVPTTGLMTWSARGIRPWRHRRPGRRCWLGRWPRVGGRRSAVDGRIRWQRYRTGSWGRTRPPRVPTRGRRRAIRRPRGWRARPLRRT